MFGKSTILRSLFLYMGCTCVCMHVCVDVNTYTLGDYAWGGVQERPAVTTEEFCNCFLSYCLRQSPIEHGWPMRANLSLSPQITNYIWLLHGPQIRPSCLPSRHFTNWTLSSAPGSIFLSWKLKSYCISNILPLTKHGHSSHLLGTTSLRYLIAPLDGMGR